MDHYSDSDSNPDTSTAEGYGRTRSMGPQSLLESVERVYKSFNPGQVTLDTHVDKCIQDMAVANSLDETFIRQVVYGVIRYRQFLGSIMDSFYHYNGGTALREDMDMYKIFGYLTIFRMEELGYGNMKRLVDAKEPQKMVVFFRYLFDEEALRGALRDDWLKLYDKEFVDGIVRQLLELKPQMTTLIDSLEEKVYFTRRRASEKEETSPSGSYQLDGSPGQGTARTSRGTIPHPFKLSEPRPKPLPVEEPPPSPPRPKPPPPRRTGPTKEEVALQATKEANRRRLEAKWARASPFKLRVTERPTHLERIRQEIEADLARQLTFKPPKPSPVPAAPTAPVRLNAAAILREDALYRKKQAEEVAALQRYEAELRDASTFKAWQSRMLSLDEAAREAEINARRIAMGAVQDSAIRARAAQVEENRELGRQLKAEAKAIEEARAREKEEEVAAKQVLRAQVVEARAAVAQAAERVAAEKRAAAEEERRRQAADAKALMEAQLRDIAEKRDIIMQLRALEKVPQQRVVVFDPTDMPDHGLLESMPLVELRERLIVAKRRAKEEEERQRARNLAARQEREEVLLDKVANIQRVRRVQAAQAQLRRGRVKEAAEVEAAAQVSAHETGVLKLNSKLEEKRAAAAAEAARIAAETKRIRFEQMQQAAGAAAVEENKFRELRQGAQREALGRQTHKLQEAGTYEQTKAKAQAVRMNALKAAKISKHAFLQEYAERLSAATAAASQAGDSARRKGR